MRKIILYILALFIIQTLSAQPVPNKEENIPHLMTFGKLAETSWGDDDFSQTFFFQIPKDFKQQVFIRVFDPDTGGKIDEIAGQWNTVSQFEVYGGERCHSEYDARET